MSKILILGHGNLGQALARVYADQKPIVWDKAELDITNANEARQKITALKPNLIFNAAALTDTKAAETTLRAEALAVNATAVGNLAQIAKNLGATFVHFSTDYVFDGRKKEGYAEIDIPKNPLNYYGFTKLEGERLMLRAYGLTHESIKYKVSSIKYQDGLNSFILPKDGDYRLDVYYEPQKWVNIGLIISGITLASIILFLIRGYKKR